MVHRTWRNEHKWITPYVIYLLMACRFVVILQRPYVNHSHDFRVILTFPNPNHLVSVVNIYSNHLVSVVSEFGNSDSFDSGPQEGVGPNTERRGRWAGPRHYVDMMGLRFAGFSW